MDVPESRTVPWFARFSEFKAIVLPILLPQWQICCILLRPTQRIGGLCRQLCVTLSTGGNMLCSARPLLTYSQTGRKARATSFFILFEFLKVSYRVPQTNDQFHL
jgi:hypothetical protein